MRGVPRAPCKDSKYNEGGNDNGQRSAANRVFPILTIPHSVLPMDIQGERGRPRDGSRFPSPHPVHENMIRKSETRFSLGINAKRLSKDHAQAIRLERDDDSS